MVQPIQSLITERLRIDPFTMEDAEGFLALYGDPGVMKYLPVPPLADIEAARFLLATYVARIETGEQFRWAIRTHDDDTIIGALKLDTPNNKERASEVGYMLAKEAWGKGYATEAMHALAGYAFTALNRHYLEALIYADNRASRKVVERLGFKLEGYFREHEWSEEEERFLDDCVYTLLEQEYRGNGIHPESP